MFARAEDASNNVIPCNIMFYFKETAFLNVLALVMEAFI